MPYDAGASHAALLPFRNAKVGLGQAVNAIHKVEKELPAPPAMQAGFQGTAEAFQASLTNEPLLIL
ncbi:MAG TPA: hypothetical protein VF742_01445, partial [Terracidiphilus sp.]